MEKHHITAGFFLGFMLILSIVGLVSAQTSHLAYGLDEAQPRKLTSSEKVLATFLKIQLNGDPVQEAVRYMNNKFKDTPLEAKIASVYKDRGNYTHVTVQQYYKNIPLEAQYVIVHVDDKNMLYYIDGYLCSNFEMSVNPVFTSQRAEEAALYDANNTKCIDAQCAKWAVLNPQEVSPDLLYAAKQGIMVYENASLCIWEGSLAYKLIIHDDVINPAIWQYFIDANTGKVLDKKNTYKFSNPPSNNGLHVTQTGNQYRQVTPSGSSQNISLNGWHDTTGNQKYFLYFKGDSGIGPWRVYDSSASEWLQNSSASWNSTDTVAITAARNIYLIQRWIRDTLGMNSIDSAGAIVTIKIRDQCTNPTYAGFTVRIPNANTAFVVLDIIGHEIGHGLQDQWLVSGSRTLDESYSDIIGTTIELASQPLGTSSYPLSDTGKADWFYSEDLSRPTEGVDYRIPQRAAYRNLSDSIARNETMSPDWPTLYDGKYAFKDRDLVSFTHSLGGIQAFAYYLLAAGNTDSVRHNEDHPYGVFSGLGAAKAWRIVEQALRAHGSAIKNFYDSKKTWKIAAQELINQGTAPANAVTIVDSAWSAVRLEGELSFISTYNNPPSAQMKIGPMGHFKSLIDSKDSAPSYRGHLGFKNDSNAIACISYYDSWVRYLDTLIRNDSTYLDTASLSGSLVFRHPSGKVFLSLSPSGKFHVRKDTVSNEYFGL